MNRNGMSGIVGGWGNNFVLGACGAVLEGTNIGNYGGHEVVGYDGDRLIIQKGMDSKSLKTVDRLFECAKKSDETMRKISEFCLHVSEHEVYCLQNRKESVQDEDKATDSN